MLVSFRLILCDQRLDLGFEVGKRALRQLNMCHQKVLYYYLHSVSRLLSDSIHINADN